MIFMYWKDRQGFESQTQLLEVLFNEQGKNYMPDGSTDLSLIALADRQRELAIGTIYLVGSRIDNKFCLGSKNVGILHSSLPTDYPKAIVPAFHTDHDELIVCTDGKVLVEYSTSLSKSATVEISVINAGEYFIAKRTWPHRVSLAPLRLLNDCSVSLQQVKASFLAVKMGVLNRKIPTEDMKQWKEPFSHQLIINWEQDETFLNNLRKERHDLWSRLQISPL